MATMPCSLEQRAEVTDRVIIRRDLGRPQVGQGHFGGAHAGQDGRGSIDGTTRQGQLIVGVSGVPQRLPPAQPEAVEGPGGGQRLGLGHGESGPADHVVHVCGRLSGRVPRRCGGPDPDRCPGPRSVPAGPRIRRLGGARRVRSGAFRWNAGTGGCSDVDKQASGGSGHRSPRGSGRRAPGRRRPPTGRCRVAAPPRRAGGHRPPATGASRTPSAAPAADRPGTRRDSAACSQELAYTSRAKLIAWLSANPKLANAWIRA